MARLKTCKICGEKIALEDSCVPYNGRYAHEKCFQIVAKETINLRTDKLKAKRSPKKREEKPKKELKENLSEEEYKYKVEYYNYYRNVMKIEVTTKIRKLSDDYRKKYRVTFQTLFYVLYYMNEIKKVNITGDMVGLIPYYIAEAKEFYTELKNIEDKNKGVDINKMYKQKIAKPRRGSPRTVPYNIDEL